MKFRNSRKEADTVVSFEPATKLIYTPERINPDAPTGLWFCIDPIDQHSVDEVCGNAACLSLAGSWDDLDGCRDFLMTFPYIVVVSPDSAWRMQAVDEIGKRAIGVPLVDIQDGYCSAPNVSGFVRKYGGSRLLDLLKYGRDIPAQGLLDIKKIEKPPKRHPTLSGIAGLDRAIGGFDSGELSIWTGRRGDGKSTLLGQLMLTALNQGKNVFAYSGELSAWRFKEWLSLQAAGPKNVTDRKDEASEKQYTFVSPGIMFHLDEWWKERFFLYDTRQACANDPDSILSVMEFARKRHGCEVFMLDNLMSLALAADKDYYRAQSDFVGRLADFAKRTETHVHLVAHPRKADTKREFLTDDIGGSGDVSNRADNAFLLERLSAEDAKGKDYGSVLTVLKNRQFGIRLKIGLNYEPRSRRFYGRDGSPEWHYAWEKPKFEEIIGEEQTPFQER